MTESEETPLVKPVNPKGNRMRDVVVLGASFLLLFSAFTVVQNLSSSVFEGIVGLAALGTLYVVFSFANLAASWIVKTLGLKLSLFLGGATYIIYVIANAVSVANEDDETLQLAILIPSAALLGVGAATLWTAQGAYVTYSAEESTLGLFNGIFWTLFISNQILGNVGAALLLSNDIETSMVFKILAGVAIVGLFMFLLIRKVDKPENNNESINSEKKSSNSLTEVVRFLADKKAIYLSPILLYTGITQAFFFGNIPLFIGSSYPGTEEEILSMKLYVMGIFGISDALGSILLGKISDKSGRLPILVFGTILHLVGYILLMALNPLNDLSVLIPVACLLGVGDAVFNTQIGGMLGFIFIGSSEAAFAAFKFYQSSSTGVLFFVSEFMKTEKCYKVEECTEPDTLPWMDIWLPVLLIPLLTGMIGIFLLKKSGCKLDSLS